MRKTDFARLAGVSAIAVGKACKSGLLDCDPKTGIDPDDEKSRLYLDRQRLAAGTNKHGGRPKRGEEQTIDLPDPDKVDIRTTNLDWLEYENPDKYLSKFDNLVTRDKAAMVLKRLVEIKRHQQALRKESGELIGRQFVLDRFASFSAALNTNLLTLPQRTAPQLVARAKADGERAVEEYLKEEIAAAIEKSISELEIKL